MFMRLLSALVAPLGSECGQIQISDLSNVLRKIIAPTIQRTLFKETVLLDKVRKNAGLIRMPNNTFYITMQTGHHSGTYTLAEGAQIRKGKAAYSQPNVAAKYAFGAFEITDQAIEAADNSRGAIATILNENGKTLKTAMRREINRQMHNDGTGQLCLANGAGSSATALIVDTPGTRYLRAGGFIEIGSSGEVEVTSVDSTTTATLATAVTWSDNDVVTRGKDDEAMGLTGIIDDGDNVATIQGITRSSNPWSKAHTDDTVETLTEDAMITQHLAAKEFGSPSVIFMGSTLFRSYGSILTSMKKTANLKEVLSGGWKGLEFMGGDVGVMLDYDTPAGYVQGVDLDSLSIAELTPISWLDRGGSILTKIPDYAKWEGTLRYYFNLACLDFQKNWRLSGKTA